MERWVEEYLRLREFLDEHDPQREFRFSGKLEKRFDFMANRVKDSFVREYVAGDLRRASRWIGEFRRMVEESFRVIGFRGVSLPKELKSFVDDPRQHMRRKLFNYFYSLLRGRLSLDGFREKGVAALTTSIRTNMRSLYQYWGLLAILVNLCAGRGCRVLYPEHRYLSLDRMGKQRAREIPPNMVLAAEGGALSVFVEAPRPIGWGDTRDLRSAWSLYVSLRPDAMVYGGVVLDIVRLGSSPPILSPDVIIEFKELPDWYKRGREVKGPLAKPLSAEEWRSRWIDGLWVGLADALGVKPKKVPEKPGGRGVRLKDPQIVLLYKKVYRPREVFVVSKYRTPKGVKRALEEVGIRVVDSVGFEPSRLAPVSESLKRFLRPVKTDSIRVDWEMEKLLGRAASITGVDDWGELVKMALKKLISSINHS